MIQFNKTGYDSFIDFIKAYSILLVVLGHAFPARLHDYTLFCVWGGMQVPLFILIQVFHAYKKGTAPQIKWVTLLKRIVVPFVLIQGILLIGKLLFSNESTKYVLATFVISGGYGPGSYYFWIYIQTAIILVWIWPYVKKLSRSQLTWSFLIFSIGCEILFSIIDLPDFVYRLLAIRYLFLIPLALVWIDKGVELNAKNVLLSIASIAAVFLLKYSKHNLEPMFYQTAWVTHRWICYYYLPTMFTYILWYIFNQLMKSDRIAIAVKVIAKCSYEIYLFQMMVFVFFPISSLSFIQSIYVKLSIWILFTFNISIFGGIMMSRWMHSIYSIKK